MSATNPIHDLRLGPPDELVIVRPTKLTSLSPTDIEALKVAAVQAAATETTALDEMIANLRRLQIRANERAKKLNIIGWAIALVLVVALTPFSIYAILATAALMFTAAIVIDAHLEEQGKRLRRSL